MGDGEGNKAWKMFLRKHWQATLLMAVFAAFAFVVGIIVFLWVAAESQATAMVPSLLGDWTVGYFIVFILNVILWELVLVGSWAIPTALLTYGLWYRRLPLGERREYEKKKGGGRDEGFSFFVWIVWLAIIWLDGNWGLPFREWALNYWIYTWLAALVWALVIAGVPGLIYVAWALAQKD